MTPEKRKILETRAAALALPRGASDPAGDLQVVQFSLGSETYAVESSYIREVCPLKDFSPIPCTPAFILGMMNVRGQILTVLNLGSLFDVGKTSLSDLNKVLILRDGAVEMGIVADAILGIRLLSSDDLQTSIPTLEGFRAELLRGVTADQMILLNAAKLLTHQSIIVNDEAAA